MGKERGRSKKSSDTSSPSSSSDCESPERKRKSRRSCSSSHREHSRHRSRHQTEEDGTRGKSRKRKSRTSDKEERKRRHRQRTESASSDSSSRNVSSEPRSYIRLILKRYPDVASDLTQLLQMIDNGQGVDISGIPKKGLVKLLKKLFRSLNLKQNENGVFLLPSKSLPTSEIIGSTLCSHLESMDNEFSKSGPPNEVQTSSPDMQNVKKADDVTDTAQSTEANRNTENPTLSKRRFIGPEMPSRELLDAAAKLTEAETLLREADVDNDLVIGPPPPAMVAEAASANEAERFEEVSRIAAAEVDKPYDILGVNWKTPFDNIKKRYWKISLMVHPDKCSHPQAHQAFVILNQAFKDLQDPNKKQALDDKIRYKEEQEAFKAELRSLREAAQWRRLQGISIEGDDELLTVEKEAPKRDEWMTTLPPERKPGVTMQSTSFSQTTKEGRGDTSMWTDNPLEKAEKAKQAYLEAYDKTIALADTEDIRKTVNSDAGLVDKYNSAKRSVSLMQKHQEETSRPKMKSKKPEKEQKEEWKGQHPWKPWDREKDLSAGRKKVNLDSEGMSQGLSSRFSSGPTQRNFL